MTLNGQIASHTDNIDEHQLPIKDVILVDDSPISERQPLAYWLFHKAVGTDCRLQISDPCSLLHLLPKYPRLYPAGRLDKDSRGLLLLTNDGELTQKLMHPQFQHEKTYEVRLNRPYDADFLTKMAQGVCYNKVTTLPCHIKRLGEDSFEIILTQGLNRQIRRMCQALGYRVVDLKRVAIGGLQLGGLDVGAMKPLTAAEIATLLSRYKV